MADRSAEPPRGAAAATMSRNDGPIGCLIALAVTLACSSTPRILAAEHHEAVRKQFDAQGLTQPTELTISEAGFVTADYIVTDVERRRLTMSLREFGELRLLAIREALLPYGFQDYRLNVNGPPPGTGLIRRYGSARFIGVGGKLEWLTPN
jgi:hypothetical protein